MLNVDLSKMAGGALQEKFNREITKVIENMQDPNTSYSTARSINIKITFKQGEEEVEVREYGKQIPGQMSFEDVEPIKGADVTAIPRRLKA